MYFAEQLARTFLLPERLGETLDGLVGAVSDLPIGLGVALTVAVVIVGIVILFRLILLFPAIAVDATGASATNAFADSNGHLWFIARSVLVAFIPMAFALVVIIALAFSNACNIPNPDTDRTLIGAAILGALETITTTSSGVVVAHLYEWIGERVKGMGDSNPDPRYHPLA